MVRRNSIVGGQMKVLVVWRNCLKHKRSFIASFENKDYAYTSIWAWWSKHNYKPEHTRLFANKVWVQGQQYERVIIDYGPHHMFYELWFVPDDFEPAYVEVNIEQRKWNGETQYRFVGFVSDELVPYCSRKDDVLCICGLNCNSTRWYSETHYEHVQKAIKNAIEIAKPAIKVRSELSHHSLIEEDPTPVHQQLYFGIEGDLIG